MIPKATIRTREDGDTTEIVLRVPPVPASRPRVSRWGTYYGKRYTKWQQAAAEALRGLRWHQGPEACDFHVAVHSVCHKPPTGRLLRPVGDVDNYIKGPLDAITKAELIWLDDKQIITLQGTKRYALGSESPHTYMKISRTLGGLWLGLGVWRPEEDVYALPPEMRVPLDLLQEAEE